MAIETCRHCGKQFKSSFWGWEFKTCCEACYWQGASRDDDGKVFTPVTDEPSSVDKRDQRGFVVEGILAGAGVLAGLYAASRDANYSFQSSSDRQTWFIIAAVMLVGAAIVFAVRRR